MDMKPFNLEEAKQGKPVCTLSGKPVEILKFDRVSKYGFPIVALIDNGDDTVLKSYTIYGTIDQQGTIPLDADLRMVELEPRYRPFKSKEECWEEMQQHEPFGWVIDNETGTFTCLPSINNSINYETYFHRFRFDDGTPFGIKISD